MFVKKILKAVLEVAKKIRNVVSSLMNEMRDVLRLILAVTGGLTTLMATILVPTILLLLSGLILAIPLGFVVKILWNYCFPVYTLSYCQGVALYILAMVLVKIVTTHK